MPISSANHLFAFEDNSAQGVGPWSALPHRPKVSVADRSCVRDALDCDLADAYNKRWVDQSRED